MTHEPTPLAVVATLDLAAVVDWVSEPATLEERRRRGEAAKRALADALAAVDHDQANAEIRSAKLRLDRTPTLKTSRPPASSWRN